MSLKKYKHLLLMALADKAASLVPNDDFCNQIHGFFLHQKHNSVQNGEKGPKNSKVKQFKANLFSNEWDETILLPSLTKSCV